MLKAYAVVVVVALLCFLVQLAQWWFDASD